MSARALLNLLIELGKTAEHLIVFPNEFNELNTEAAPVQDSIYHMTLKSRFIIYIYIYCPTNEMLHTFFANGSNRNVEN